MAEHISDFTQGEDKIVLDLVNHDNELNLSSDQVDVGAVAVIGEGRVSVQLTAKMGSGYASSDTVTYKRLDIQEFIDLFFNESPLLQQGDATHVSDFLPEINAALGTALAESSIVDVELIFQGDANEVLQTNLIIHPLSKVYHGQAILRIDGNDIALDSAIAVKILSGLNMPTTDVEFTRIRMIDGGTTQVAELRIAPLSAGYAGIAPRDNVITAGRVVYKINDGAEIPYVANDVITLPVGTQSLSVQNNSEKQVQLVPINSTVIQAAGIDEFQTTGHPVINWEKTSHFVSLPDAIPESVTNLGLLAYGATNFNQNINDWDVSRVTRMREAFAGASVFNQPLNKWDTAVLTDTYGMFKNAAAFNQDISGWKMGAVNAIDSMFNGASAFNQPLTSWNISQNTTFTNMFRNALAFNKPIGNWNMANAVNLLGMFQGAAAFNQPLNDWDINGVVNLSFMFNGATSFNQPLDDWDTTTVLNLESTFNGASAYNQDLSSWVVEQVTNKVDFAKNAPAWVQPQPPFYPAREWTRLKMRSGNSSYRGLVFGPTGLVAGQISYRFDEGAWQDLALTPTNANHIYIPPTVTFVDIRNNSESPFPAITAPGYGVAEVEGIVYLQTDRVPAALFPKSQYFTFVPDNIPATLTSLNAMFQGATQFNQNISGWDTSNVRNVYNMLNGAVAFNQNLSGWNVSNVEWWSGFDTGATAWVAGNKPTFTIPTTYTRYKNRVATSGARGLSVGPSGLVNNQVSYRINSGPWVDCNTSGANTHEIPVPAGTLTVDIRNNGTAAIPNIIANASGFPDFEGIEFFQANREPVVEFKKTQYFTFVPSQIPSTITKLLNLFYGATTFNQDISGWDVSKITNMQSLFYQASAFNRDISGWKVGKVTNMNSMFREAAAFNQDLHNWCVSLIGSKPGNFDTSTTAWNKTNRQPVWGTCPLGS